MKTFLMIVAVILMFFGTVWFLQGINILPGSFMTGQLRWAINGALAFVAGLALLLFARRLKRRHP